VTVIFKRGKRPRGRDSKGFRKSKGQKDKKPKNSVDQEKRLKGKEKFRRERETHCSNNAKYKLPGGGD